MKTILDFLKKIFRIGVIGNIIASLTLIITIIFGYSQYAKTRGQEVSPIIQDQIDKSKEHNTVIVRTNDTIRLLNPSLCPSFRNTSKYSINNLFIETTVITPIFPKYYAFYKPADQHKGYSQRMVENMLHTTYTYKAESLYPNETTIPFIKEFTMIPQDEKDSLFFWLQIKTKILWDGQSPIEYFSTIWYRYVNDDYNLDHLVRFDDKQDSIHYTAWLNKVVKRIKGKISNDKTDLFLAYHCVMDSIPDPAKHRGAYVRYHDMNNAIVDSIVCPSWLFLQKHEYLFDKLKYEIDYSTFDVVVGIIFFLLLVVFASFGYKILKGAILRGYLLYFLILITLITTTYSLLRRWLVFLGISSVSFYNQSWIICLIGLVILSGFILFLMYLDIKIIITYIRKPPYYRKTYLKSQSDNLFLYSWFALILGGIAYTHYDVLMKIYHNPLIDYM